MSQCLGLTRSNLANLVPSALFWGWDVTRPGGSKYGASAKTSLRKKEKCVWLSLLCRLPVPVMNIVDSALRLSLST